MSRLRLPIINLWLVGIVVAACTPASPPSDPEAVGGTPADARALVESWLGAARGATSDRGWSMIHPVARSSVIGTEQQYREAVEAADWAGFSFRITDVSVVDGQYRVEVTTPGGAGQVPSFMIDWGIIQFPEPEDDAAPGLVFVRIPPAGEPSGILVG